MNRFPDYRLGSTNCTTGICEVHRRVGGSADFTYIPVLVHGTAARTGSLNVSIRKESGIVRTVVLGDGAFDNVPPLLQPAEDQLGMVTVLRAVGRVEAVEMDVEVLKVLLVFFVVITDQFLRADALLAGLHFDGCSMCIIRAHIHRIPPGELKKSHQYVGLDVLYEVTKMNAAVRIRERTRNQYLFHFVPFSPDCMRNNRPPAMYAVHFALTYTEN